MADAAYVESGIVGDEYGAFLQIFGYFVPHCGKFGRIGGVTWADAVNLYVPIAVVIVLRADKPRTGFRYLSVAVFRAENFIGIMICFIDLRLYGEYNSEALKAT